MKTKLTTMILAAGAMLGAWAANVRVYVNVMPEAGWNPDRYFYAWSGTVQNFGAWPGIKVENTEVLNGATWHYMDIDATNEELYLIFNDGEAHCQSSNVLLAPVKDGKRFFVRISSEVGINEFSGNTINYANIEFEKVQLWEGGPYWATMNIGAEIPEDYGYYFWWGDTIGYKRENDKWVASDGSSSDFSFESGNTPTYNKDVATLKSEGWITADGVLHPTNDAAHVQWGGGWRMPTYQELSDLNSKCDWTWTTQNGVNGYIVRGRGDYASNSIFLPCCGWGDETSFDGSGLGAYYWSSVPGSDRYNAYELYFRSDRHDAYYGDYRRFGSSVRPVQDALAPATVTFDENFEGGSTTNISFLSTSKVLANVPAVPARVGWELVGWFDAAEGGNQISADALPTDGATYYAHWQKVSYVAIGSGTAVNTVLPTHSYYKYSLTEQIYTSAEIGGACLMDGISFRSNMETSRSLDVYLVHTDKSAFGSSTDWIGVTASDKVFSGSVVFTADDWTKITFDTPFIYNGTDNLAVVVDDNTGTYVSGLAFYVFDAPGTAIRVYSDGTNYDPANASTYNGAVLDVKNQIRLEAAELVEVSVTFDENFEGGSTTNMSTYSALKVLASAPAVSARAGWTFGGWYTESEGGEKITADALPTDGATYYAHWLEGEFTFGGTVEGSSWTVDADGVWYSGRIPDGNGCIWFAKTVRGPGTFSFEWKLPDGDNNCIWLECRVNKDEYYNELYGGVTEWQRVTIELDEGEHDIFFIYGEDGDPSLSGGGWVRNLRFGDNPVTPDVSITAGEYFKATLAELGYDVPTDGKTAYTVKAYGLPAGLKLMSNKAVTKKVKKGKKTTTVVVTPAKTEWWIEGVPTAALDYATNPPYLVITTNGVAQTLPLSLGVEAQEVTELPDLALGYPLNEQFYLSGVTNGWTVSGLPTGLKYTAKLVTTTKKKGKKVVSVTTNALPYSVYGKTTKAGLFTSTAKKKVGAYYETLKFRVLVNPAPVDTAIFGDELTNIVTMAYEPFEWYLTNDVSAVGGKVAKVAGLPTGLTFAAANTYSDKKKTKLKQSAQTIVGKPTKPGTYVVTFTKNVTTGTGRKKKTVAKTAQILWTVKANDAELSLGFNEKGGVIESGTVGLSYGDLMAFDATDGAKVTASGLPAGIKLADLGGGKYAFKGFTAKAGTYLVTVTATLNGKTVRQRVALKVDGLPSWAKGTYNGVVYATSGDLDYAGYGTVSVSSAGKISGKFSENGTNWTFSASSYDFYTDKGGYDGDTEIFQCTNVVAKYAYKVTEKDKKGKKKTVTKYLARNYTLSAGNLEVSPGVMRGTMVVTSNGDDGLVAYQNVWGQSGYKALGKKLFYTSKKVPYKTWTSVEADGLGEYDMLSMKVTPAGVATATYKFFKGTFDKKGKPQYATYACTTVLHPETSAEAGPDGFGAMIYLYFPSVASAGFKKYAEIVRYPFTDRKANVPDKAAIDAAKWCAGEYLGYGYAEFPGEDWLYGIFRVSVGTDLAFTGTFEAIDGGVADFSGKLVKNVANGVAITVSGTPLSMGVKAMAKPYGKSKYGEIFAWSEAEEGQPNIHIDRAWQNIWTSVGMASARPKIASGTTKTVDLAGAEIYRYPMGDYVEGDSFTYTFAEDGTVSVTGQVFGVPVDTTTSIAVETESGGTCDCILTFMINGRVFQQNFTMPSSGTVTSESISLDVSSSNFGIING